MTTLHVVIDEMLAVQPTGIARYTEELTRELILSAPRGCYVEGIVASSTEVEYQVISDRLPGLNKLFKSALARRQLESAWQHGVTRVPSNGMLHAPSLLAPLGRHDRLNSGDQVAVTIHDTLAWSHPESLGTRAASWRIAMARRAEKYADAIVVPTHSVAEDLADRLDIGDRIRVIGGAASANTALPVDAGDRTERMGLPPRFVLTVGGLAPHRGIGQLIQAMADPAAPLVPLAIAGTDSDDPLLVEAVSAAGLPEGRVLPLGVLSDGDLAVAYSRAAVVVCPGLNDGFSLSMVEAFALGTPVVHADSPALMEIATDAGVVVQREAEGYPRRLAEAISAVLGDHAIAERLRFSGLDRAKAFSWRASAEKVWQLHADL